MPIILNDDDIKEQRSISQAEMEKWLAKEREKWESQKKTVIREKGASRRSPVACWVRTPLPSAEILHGVRTHERDHHPV